MTFEIAFLHRYQPNFRHVLPEIFQNEVSDLDLEWEEENLQCDQTTDPASSKIQPTKFQRKNQISEAMTTQFQQFQRSKITIPETARISDWEAEITDQKQRIRNNNSEIQKDRDLNRAFVDLRGGAGSSSGSEADLNATDPLAMTEKKAEAATCDAGRAMASGDPTTADDVASADVTQTHGRHQIWHRDMASPLAVGSGSGVHHAGSSHSTLLLAVVVPQAERMVVAAGDILRSEQVPTLAFPGAAMTVAKTTRQIEADDGTYDGEAPPVRGGEAPQVRGDRRIPWSSGCMFVVGRPATMAMLPWVRERSYWNGKGTDATLGLHGEGMGSAFLGLAQFDQSEAKVRARAWQTYENYFRNFTSQAQMCAHQNG